MTEQLKTGAERAAARERAKYEANKAFYAKAGDYAVETRQVQRQRLRQAAKAMRPGWRDRAVNLARDAARAARDGSPANV